ncbi:hypothetical protein EMMF5_000855 [Cystobasidiomycetes sp. EMM_F5]
MSTSVPLTLLSMTGGLTLLVNNAGIMKLAPIADTDEALFDLHYKLNVKGPFFLAKAAIPYASSAYCLGTIPLKRLDPRHLQAGIGGVIFLSTSVTAATAVRPQYITYASNKGAIEQISRILAKDLGAKGIRVNTVSPGPVETQLFLSQSPAPAVEAAKQFSPFVSYLNGLNEFVNTLLKHYANQGRLGQPDEIADVIVYLASEQARWVSGQNM